MISPYTAGEAFALGCTSVIAIAIRLNMVQLALFSYSVLLGLFVGEIISLYILAVPLWLARSWIDDSQMTFKAYTRQDKLNYLRRFEEIVSSLSPRCVHCYELYSGSRRLALLRYLFHNNSCSTCDFRSQDQAFRPQLVTIIGTTYVVVSGGLEPKTLIGLFQLWLLIAIAFISVRQHLVPNVLTYPLLWGNLLASAFGLAVPIESAVIGAVVGYMGQWLILIISRFTIKQELVGYGSFMAGAAIGAMLGWEQGCLAIAFAYILKLGENMVRYRKLLGPTQLVPLGHWLVMSALSIGMLHG
ncbi:prepilin peptidase [Denitratisoma oestradiolicum]|uniref:Putative Prepilin peptidase n=1 Tax=Denitratisoma oestradiolicum TaxID=311182 RepID=A0A6S6Y6P9_9PROT|nr:A24 family peptidase [Denitratisoma oestradiolicum]TWO78958.1 hypothetical protein CBW56_17215 [Denitratisoma oestradiolicum]CAB1368198.1 putative Prepilin peptidase [Denitratisoma oestradiolicum]